MRKINDKSNLAGEYLKECRIKKKINRTDMATQLQLNGLNMTVDEIYRIETSRVILKDFELIAFCIVLDIDFNCLKELYKNSIQ